MLLFLGVLNAIDAIATVYTINAGLGYEANPIMAFALNISPYFFLFIKLLLIPWLLWGLVKSYSKPIFVLICIIVVLYLLVDLNHAYNLFLFRTVNRF